MTSDYICNIVIGIIHHLLMAALVLDDAIAIFRNISNFIEPKISHIERRFLNWKFLKDVMHFLVYNCT